MSEDATTPDMAYGERLEKIEQGQAGMQAKLDACPACNGVAMGFPQPVLPPVPDGPLIKYKSEFEMQRPRLSGWARAGTVGGGVSFVSLAIVVILALTGNLDTRAPAYASPVSTPSIQQHPSLRLAGSAGASARVLSQWLNGRERHRLSPTQIAAARAALIADGATSD